MSLADLLPSRGTIARQLFALSLGTLLPVLLFAALLIWLQARAAHATFERDARDRVLALSTAVDAELRASVAALRTLAASQALADQDMAVFHAVASRVVKLQRDWVEVNLAQPDGTLLINTTLPYGTPPQQVNDPASLQQAMRQREPVIGNLAFGPHAGRSAFPVRLAVWREGRVAYVLTAAVDPAAIERILREQGMPQDWVASVVDGQLTQVSRLHRGQVQVGVGVAPDFRNALTSGAPEGSYRGRTLEGTPSHVAWVRSRFSGWAVGVGIPASDVEASARQVMVLGSIGAAVAIALALALARVLARHIVTPVAMLAVQARAIRHGGDGPSPPASPPASAPATSIAGAVELRELQQALDEAGQAMRALRRAREQADATDRAKDEFLAMLGHELRNPLSAIANAAYLLRRRPDEAAAQTAQGVLQRQIAQLTRLVDDLLDVGRVSQGKIALQRRPLDLTALVQRVASVMVGASRRHRLQLRLEPTWVEGDETRLEQILSNLLSNALRYSPAGGVVELVLSHAGGSAQLAVRDEGVGLSPKLLPRVFDMFVQGERGIEREQGGLGIGLTLAQRLAELHGGRLDAASEGEGRGSTFTLSLPRIDPPLAADLAAPAHAAAEAPPLDVLLVEDNDDVRRMLRAAIEQAGHRVTEAADGPQALQRAIGHDAGFDIAIIDIGLPGLSGLEVARRLRQLPPERVPRLLVALTGYGSPEDRMRSRDAGFDLHVVKPVDAAALLAQLQAMRPVRTQIET